MPSGNGKVYKQEAGHTTQPIPTLTKSSASMSSVDLFSGKKSNKPATVYRPTGGSTVVPSASTTTTGTTSATAVSHDIYDKDRVAMLIMTVEYGPIILERWRIDECIHELSPIWQSDEVVVLRPGMLKQALRPGVDVRAISMPMPTCDVLVLRVAV